MDKLDYGVIGFYVLIIAVITIIGYRPKWQGMFKVTYHTKWWIPGLSLVMMIMSTDGPQLITGIVIDQALVDLDRILNCWCSANFICTTLV